jgi:tRNA A22 N-methylase
MENKNLIEHIDKSINNALKHVSNIDNNDILSIVGMSSDRNRHLLNNLLNVMNNKK